jgi:homocitrate synthase NifV
MIRSKLETDHAHILQQIDRCVKLAVAMGLRVCVGGEDASRAKPDFLQRAVETAEKAGASRFRFADTLGILDPFATHDSISLLRKNTSLEIEIHAHDDLGMATANTLAAIKAGATHASTTINGLGERAGNAAMEEVLMGMWHLHGTHCGIDLLKLPELSNLVAAVSGRPLHWQKSIVGEGAFTHEAGIHVDGILKDPDNYQPFDPQIIGRQHQFMLGKHSGRKGVRHAFHALGLTLSPEDEPLLLDAIRHIATTTKTPPDSMQLKQFYHHLYLSRCA